MKSCNLNRKYKRDSPPALWGARRFVVSPLVIHLLGTVGLLHTPSPGVFLMVLRIIRIAFPPLPPSGRMLLQSVAFSVDSKSGLGPPPSPEFYKVDSRVGFLS